MTDRELVALRQEYEQMREKVEASDTSALDDQLRALRKENRCLREALRAIKDAEVASWYMAGQYRFCHNCHEKVAMATSALIGEDAA